MRFLDWLLDAIDDVGDVPPAGDPVEARARRRAEDDRVAADVLRVPVHRSVTFTEQLTQALSWPVQPLFPVSQAFDNANAVTVPPTGDGVDMSKFHRIIASILAGVGAPNNGTAKIQAWWTGSNTNNGSYTAFPTNTVATINTNNSQSTLELRCDQLPAGNRWVKLNILVPVANMLVAAEIVGADPNYSPASQWDWTANTSLLNRIVY